ncbi:unnamed protein product, partial [Cyprideis torosa]
MSQFQLHVSRWNQTIQKYVLVKVEGVIGKREEELLSHPMLPLKDFQIQLNAAFWDDRWSAINPKAVAHIRAFAMVTSFRNEPLNCILTNDNEVIASVPAAPLPLWSYCYPDRFTCPYLFSCPMVSNESIVKEQIRVHLGVNNSVSLEASAKVRSSRSVSLTVPSTSSEPHQKQFVVCVKPLYYTDRDFTWRLVEWLEMLRILGADHVEISYYQLHPNMEKVLSYYQKTLSFVSLVKTDLTGTTTKLTYQRLFGTRHTVDLLVKNTHEQMACNLCLYRNLKRFKYVVSLDIDEVIVPGGTGKTWNDMILTVRQRYGPKDLRFADGNFSITVPQALFYDEFSVDDVVPKYLHMIRHR